MKDEMYLRSVMKNAGIWDDNGHYAYSSGRHGNTHYDKYGLSVQPEILKLIGRAMAEASARWKSDVVISPAYSGISLTQWTAVELHKITGKKVFAVYVIKSISSENNKFTFTGNLYEYQKDKRVVILEDNINTGESIYELKRLVESYSGTVVGVVSVMNRGNVLLENDLPHVTLFTKNFKTWPASECLLCPNPIDEAPQRIV